MADPRDRRGMRHDLPTVLSPAVTRVLAGYRSPTTIWEHTIDLTGADLTGATITGATALDATFANTTCPDGTVVSSPATCFP